LTVPFLITPSISPVYLNNPGFATVEIIKNKNENF
jgi:hypothetical protein